MSCPSCQSSEAHLYFTKRVNRTDHAIVQCDACGLLYLDPMPTAAELDAYYNNPAYFDGDEAGYGDDYLKQRASIDRDSHRRLKRIQAMAPSNGERHILDIGCAAGFFLDAARRQGWRVSGVELSTDMAAHASALLGVDVPVAFDARNYAPVSFDAITLWEVIEHLPHPLDMLQQLRLLLKPGGVVALSTPNTGHWQAQHKPDWWNEFKPPAHVIYFTEATLKDTLQRAGFQRITFEKTRPITLPPSALAQLRRLRGVLGDGANRRTPLWFITSGVYRAANGLGSLGHAGEDNTIGLEAYAQP